ncbi:hypothetical protein EFQ99_32505 [Rhizobium vallis]|uniref:Uncharacterized protein n=1 Tax=Rhizobium vallis TaxID=634290 RepID=A0A432PBM8_9HYPH|nr:hypothetical protein EFQ99_32505 [Rhizobium vallis]
MLGVALLARQVFGVPCRPLIRLPAPSPRWGEETSCSVEYEHNQRRQIESETPPRISSPQRGEGGGSRMRGLHGKPLANVLPSCSGSKTDYTLTFTKPPRQHPQNSSHCPLASAALPCV